MQSRNQVGVVAVCARLEGIDLVRGEDPISIVIDGVEEDFLLRFVS